MGDSSAIQWTEATWNPSTGCTKVSPGCDNCYAEALAERLRAMGVRGYEHGFTYTEHPDRLDIPRHWKRGRRIFVNSMSDLFHQEATNGFLAAVFDVMQETPRHIYQVLTKRPNRAAAWVREYCAWHGLPELPAHIWMGTSVENQAAVWRIDHLLRIPASMRFLSIEPLLGPVNLERWLLARRCPRCEAVIYMGVPTETAWCAECCVAEINTTPAIEPQSMHHGMFPGRPLLDWVIVGGESGPRARPCRTMWIRDIIEQCRAAGVPVFVKQVGRHPLWEGDEGRTLRDHKGGDPAEWPQDLRVREYLEARA